MREPDPEALRSLYVGASTRPKSAEPDVASDEPVRFTSDAGRELTTPHPLSKAAFLELGAIWPRWVRVSDLLSAARARVSAAGGRPATAEDETRPAPIPPRLLRRERGPPPEHAVPLRDGDFGAPPGERSREASGARHHRSHEPPARECSARRSARQDLPRASRRHPRSHGDRGRDGGSPSGRRTRDRGARGGRRKGNRPQLRPRGPARVCSKARGPAIPSGAGGNEAGTNR